MSEWKQRRFWTSAGVVETAEGFVIELDARRVKTPNKSLLCVPSKPMAEAIAAEWDAQDDVVNPLTMPFTRSANSALDKVHPQKTGVAEMLAEYGDSDLLCYRADGPEALIERQAAQWDPALDWAAARFGARLAPRTGVMHAAQDPEALARLAAEVQGLSDFELTGFHDLVSLSGSLVLAFAAAEDWKPIEDIWLLSRLDEIWQEEKWGVDEDAQQMALHKRGDFLHAKAFFDMARIT